MDDGSWSRAYMAASGLSFSHSPRKQSPEQHIAEGADLSLERMLKLARHRDSGVREALARRHDCAFGVLVTLAHDGRSAVRSAVASHPSAGATVLELLAGDRDPFVVKAVVRNAAVPQSLLTQLTRHRRPEVRHLVEHTITERHSATPPGAPPAWMTDRASHADDTSAPNPASPWHMRVPRALPPRPVPGRGSRQAAEQPAASMRFAPGT
ncbi:hypothetical protein [Demequina flava]|uniref:hypothetical protein n=1 Tax=Demequina flava TaxID=1095025 RepID=UPI00128B4C73|nr:hypothetical protein [Demequina flava]